ncbi:MAG: matrixin family metalloprotease [Nitrososphaera sp.]
MAILPTAAVMSAPSSRTYESVEFLEGVTEHAVTESGHYTIATNAFWLDKPSLAISVSSEDGVSDEAVRSVKGMISGNTTVSGKYSQWNDLLSAFKQASVPHLVLAAGDGADANIKVVLTDAAQQDNKPGKTRLLADKATGEIVQAEVYVYSADKLFEQGVLEYVVAHELGHALGLSHSTDPQSMMYPLIELQDGHVVNHLGSCETEGISALYLESRIGSEAC